MGARPRPCGWGGFACLTALVLAGFLSRLQYGFEWDELQLLHGAWNVADGHVPYRDFFEHHPPVMLLLLAPIVGAMTELSWPLLVGVRIVALGVLAGVLAAGVRVVRPATPVAVGAWTASALLVVCPLSGKFFELRADWPALAGVLLAAGLVAPSGARSMTRWGLAGVLLGLATGLTQKAVPAVLALGLWTLLPRPGVSTPRAVGRACALAGGIALALLPVVLGFAQVGAADALLDGAIRVNLDWPREVDWRVVWRENLPAVAGPAVLALAATLRLIARGARPAGALALLAVAALAGALAYRATPVPWEQSVLFLVAPWMAGLAVATVGRWAAHAGARRADAPYLVVAVLAITVLVPIPARPTTVALWGVLAAVLWATLRIGRERTARARRALCLLLLPGMIQFGADRVADATDGRGAAQQAFVHRLADQVGPDEPVLVLWDHVLPFRPDATYHWFAHEGVLRRWAARAPGEPDLDGEYADAVAAGRVRWVIASTDLVDRHLPRLGALLRARCRLEIVGYTDHHAYRCRPARES